MTITGERLVNANRNVNEADLKSYEKAKAVELMTRPLNTKERISDIFWRVYQHLAKHQTNG